MVNLIMILKCRPMDAGLYQKIHEHQGSLDTVSYTHLDVYKRQPVVIIQGHMDMVCEKRPDVEHDFTKDGLNLSVEGDYVSANGTTPVSYTHLTGA